MWGKSTVLATWFDCGKTAPGDVAIKPWAKELMRT
jgi:hypothetical protein